MSLYISEYVLYRNFSEWKCCIGMMYGPIAGLSKGPKEKVITVYARWAWLAVIKGWLKAQKYIKREKKIREEIE